MTGTSEVMLRLLLLPVFLVACENNASDTSKETAVDTTPVDLSVEGWTVVSGNPIQPGVAVVLQKDDAFRTMAPTVGVLRNIGELPQG